MNLSNIAKKAGVSVSTVSKAFSGSREIGEQTRQRIFEIARDEGCFDKYNKNPFPKPVIAVICPESESAYYNAILSRLDREISARGGVMAVSFGGFDSTREEELFYYYSAYCRASGIILINTHCSVKNPAFVPTVGIGIAGETKNVSRIVLEQKKGIEAAVQYLKAGGHREIGFVGEALTVSKMNAFKQAMRRAGLRVDDALICLSSARFERAGIEIAKAWLAQGRVPSAILAAYDNIAVGVIKTLQEGGLRVPLDVSVIGMDDIAIAPYLETPLSSIRTHTEDACCMAVELLMRKIENQYYSEREEIVIPSEFIVRESSAAHSAK